MNFYELFEKKEDSATNDKEHQEVTIADPKAAIALKQARAKYTYAKSDLEAFVKMTQDEEEKDQQEIEKIEKDNDRQEREIQDLETKEQNDAVRIKKLENEINLSQELIKDLHQREEEYEQLVSKYGQKFAEIDRELTSLEDRLKDVPNFAPAATRTKMKLPDPMDFALNPKPRPATSQQS